MTIYNPTEGRILSQAIDEISTTKQVPLLTRVRAIDLTTNLEGEYIYLLGVASTAVGSVVVFSPVDGSTSLATANDKGIIAVAMSANVASSYGWYQIYGVATAKVLTGFADNATVYLTATAGSVDDAVVAGDRIKGCKGGSAIGTPSAGLAYLEISYPYVDDIADA